MTQLNMYPAMINSPMTQLSGAIDNVQNSIPLVDASVLPAGPNLCTIGSDETAETILYTAKSVNTLTGITRGFQSAAKAWASGAKVARYLTAYDVDTMRLNLIDHETRISLVESAYPLHSVTRQAVINSGFKVNQLGVSGTVTLVAGQYGHDMWKAGAAGCTYTFATANNVTTITITAGSLIQVIEGINLFDGTYALAWFGTAQGKIGAGSFGASGITRVVVGGTDLSIEFNVGTLGNVQFNIGSVALLFQPKDFEEELMKCQRFCQIMKGVNLKTPLSSLVIPSDIVITIPLKVSMRVPPTISLTGVRGTDWALATITAVAVTTGTLVAASTGNDFGSIQFTSGTYTSGTPHYIVLITASGSIILDARL